MPNFIQPGLVISLTLGSGETAIAVGKIYQKGALSGVVQSVSRNGVPILSTEASASGDVIELGVAGVFEVTKEASLAIAVGDRCYNNALTASKDPADGPYLGICVEAAAGDASTVKVLLGLSPATVPNIATGANIATTLTALDGAGIINLTA